MKQLCYLSIVLSTGLISCSKGGCSNAEKGIFKDLTGLDGCGMVIELNNGKTLEPINMGDFQITPEDGKKIWVSYHIPSGGYGSICMVGDIVELDCLTER